MFINVHLIHHFPASNLNRDDTGAPKDTIFGGYRRARISSQCQKRNIRIHDSFRKALQKSHDITFGKRSRNYIEIIAEHIKEKLNLDDDDSKLLSEALCLSIGPAASEDGKTEYLLFLTDSEIESFLDYLSSTPKDGHGQNASIMLSEWKKIKSNEKIKKKKDAWKKKKEYKNFQKFLREIKPKKPAPDIALFGRFVSDNSNMDVEAACQVSHAISTHKSIMETDYFTAVDDLLTKEESGAGMIDVVEYNGACYYRYANVDFGKLKENLGYTNADLAAATVTGFVQAMVEAIPTGMQNSFAAQTLPAYLEVTILDAPISYANAFSKPAQATEKESIEERSIQMLDKHASRTMAYLGKEPKYRFVANFYDEQGSTIPQLLEDLRSALEEL